MDGSFLIAYIFAAETSASLASFSEIDSVSSLPIYDRTGMLSSPVFAKSSADKK